MTCRIATRRGFLTCALGSAAALAETVDKIKIGKGRRGPITEALQTAFFDMINGETPDRHGWLTYVYPGEPLQPAEAGSAKRTGSGV